MRPSLILSALLFSIGVAVNCHAAELWVAGDGQLSCGKFNAALKLARPGLWLSYQGFQYAAEISDYMSWINGYITAANETRSLRGIGSQIEMDKDGIAAWIQKYCNEHPTDSIYYAAAAYVASVK